MLTLLLSALGLGSGGFIAHLLFPALFPGIWDALGKAPRWLIYGALGLIALTLAFIWHGHAVKQIKDAAFAAGVASVKAARAQARVDQEAVNHAPAAKSQAIAEKSNDEAPAYYRAVRDAADRHAVRVRQDAQGGGGSAGLPGAATAVESVHRPDPAAELVCRPALEDQQIVTAAGRAAEMHQEALDLIELGVAVPADTR